MISSSTFNVGNFEHATHEPLPPHAAHHLPPHLRRERFRVNFDRTEWDVLYKVFGDEDTASAAARIIEFAPPEMQIVAFQLIDVIKECE